MRYLIDTNIIVYIISDPDSLDNNVKAIIADPDNILYTSAESAKELVIAYRNKGLLTKRWKNVEDMLHSIEDDSTPSRATRTRQTMSSSPTPSPSTCR